MSTGFQGKFQRQNHLSRFAKDLVRRSRSHCELCGKNGVRLEVYELPPLPEEPSPDGCVFICEPCLKQITHPRRMIPSHWRCLNQAIWSETHSVQALSLRILRRLANTKQAWAQELLDQAYVDPETEAWSLEAE